MVGMICWSRRSVAKLKSLVAFSSCGVVLKKAKIIFLVEKDVYSVAASARIIYFSFYSWCEIEL